MGPSPEDTKIDEEAQKRQRRLGLRQLNGGPPDSKATMLSFAIYMHHIINILQYLLDRWTPL